MEILIFFMLIWNIALTIWVFAFISLDKQRLEHNKLIRETLNMMSKRIDQLIK